MFQRKTLREVILVAGLWLSASAALAAPRPEPLMPLGRAGPVPVGYIAFCMRQPLQCDGDKSLMYASGQRPLGGAAAQTTDVAPAATSASVDALHHGAVSPEGLGAFSATDAVAPAVQTAALQPSARPARLPPIELTPEVWSAAKQVNGKINRVLLARTDAEIYGVGDYWDTPLEAGRRSGDCEDFVLEKRRALIEAGVPSRALNIALVLTPRGESHAVLLLTTSSGEFVLDNLSPWIMSWTETDYRWLERQVDGEAYSWAMVPASAPDAMLRMASAR